MRSSLSPRTNHLIAGLPDDARQRWMRQLERVELPRGLALRESGSQMSYAYFPTTAVVSLVSETADGESLELAVVGNEGIVGVELFLGGGSTLGRAVVKTAGEALRLPARMVQDEIERAGSAAHLLLQYSLALFAQVAQAVVCSRHHSLDQRLCRWLLMSLDGVQGNEVIATHDQIANVLGVRREGVTEGAIRLQRLGLIRCARGRILALDRNGLAKQTCECYAVVKNEFDRLLPETVANPDLRPAPAELADQTAAPDHAPTPAVIAVARPTRPEPAAQPWVR